VLAACKNSDEFEVSGKFENHSGLKSVTLYKGDTLADSAVLNENGEFEFKASSPGKDFYYISAGEKTYPLILENGDEIEFKADFASQTPQYQVAGSDDSEKLQEFNALSARFGKVYMDLQQEYQDKVSKNPAIKDSIEHALYPRFEKNMDDFAKATIAFGKENKDNLAGFYAMSSLDPARYESDLLNYAENIKGKFPSVRAVQDFLSKVSKLQALSVGKVAPDFEMASLDGDKVKLSQLRGKYVLLDFWASWCAPCREENPNVVKQYNAFKNKGFTVLGVSLDRDREQWKKAIKDDGLTWTHVSELKHWDSDIVKQYAIEGIPSSFLLDKEGKILAKNLRGEELQQFLTKLLQ
jgi:peroxiredoxin